MSDSLDNLAGMFAEHMKVKNYSPETRAGYGRELLRFLEFLKEKDISDVRKVTRDLLQAYQFGITCQKNEGGYTAATVALKIRAVKRFFEYLESSNQILINPAEYLKEPKKESRIPRTVLSEEEVRKILDQPNLSLMTGIRDRTILEVFYSTGIRLEEMVNLSIFDCDLQGGFLRVNKGKFAKDRVITLGKHAIRFLKEYLARVRPLHNRNNRTTRDLFLNCLGRAFSRVMIEIMVRKYAKAAGIQKKVTPHVFRHNAESRIMPSNLHECSPEACRFERSFLNSS